MSPDAVQAIGSVIQRDWGYSGYRIEKLTGLGWTGGAIAEVWSSDGGVFHVAADRFGQTAYSLVSAQECADKLGALVSA